VRHVDIGHDDGDEAGTESALWSGAPSSEKTQLQVKFCKARRRALARRLWRTVPQLTWHLLFGSVLFSDVRL